MLSQRRKQRKDREMTIGRRTTMGGMSFVDTNRPMTVMTEKPMFTDPAAPMPPNAAFAAGSGSGNVRDSVASVNIAGRGATGGGYGDYDPHVYTDNAQYSGTAYTDDDMYNAQPMQHHDASAYGGWTGGYSDQQGGYADMERSQGQHGYGGEYDQGAYAYTADTQQYAYGDHTQQHHTAGYAQ